MVAAAIPAFPCGNKNPVLAAASEELELPAVAALASLAYDFALRARFGGTTLNYFIVEETVLPTLPTTRLLGTLSARLSYGATLFAPAWLSLLDSLDDETPQGLEARATMLATPWRQLWAVTPHERLRLRCILDAVVAHLYGLDEEDFRWILRDCDHPAEQVTNKAFARTLDPKGFWRVDKHKDPELRHTVLAQVAFADLKKMIRDLGIAGVPPAQAEQHALAMFLGGPNPNAPETGQPTVNAGGTPAIPGDGWMLPERLCLADYGLGHEARAREPQPVAERLGPRFYDWQLTQSPEESWEECRMHAEKIRRIRAIGRPEREGGAGSLPAKSEKKPGGKRTKEQAGLFDNHEQGELF